MNALLLAAVLGLLLAARGGRRAFLWFALALAGQGVSLGLYRAGPVVGYHHYRPPANRVEFALLAAGIAAQAAMVAWGLRREGPAIGAWVREHLPGWRAWALFGALFVAAAKISRPAQVSAAEFAFAIFVQLLAIANLILAVHALSPAALARLDARLDRLLGAESAAGEAQPGGLDRFVWVLAVLSVALAWGLNVTVYERHPHVPDEVVYLIHARYFAAGRLWLPVPPVPAGFDLDLMLTAGDRWYCPVPPGWPMALAVGAYLGATSLVNPVLGGLTILVTYLFAREITDRRSARWIVLLLAASPWFVFLNMSYMTHSWTLFCAVFAAFGVARAGRTGNSAWCWAAGAAIGMVALIRPLEGAVLALALGVWGLGFGGRRLSFASLAGLVLATAAVGGLLLLYNRTMTGAPFQHPIVEYVDKTYGKGKNDFGFGPDKGLGWTGLDPWPGHTPFQALVNAQFNLFAVDAELFGWSSGSLVLVFLLLLAGKPYRKDRAMLGFIAAIVIANSFYWYAGGPDFGARYWYLIIVPLIVLTVSGLRVLEHRIREPARVRAAVLAVTAFALLAFVPWRAMDKYSGFRGMNAGIRRLAARTHFGRSLVLVHGRRHPEFASAAVYNPLDLEADAPIYAWDRDPATRRALIEHYRDRTIWLVGADPESGRWFVSRGPGTADDASSWEFAE